MKAGWQVKKLGDVCTVIAGQSPEGKFYNALGDGLPFYQGKKEFAEKYIGKPTTWTTFVTKEAEKDDVLMSVRAPVGPINFSTEKICIGRGLAAIRASKLINKDFLFNFLLKHEAEIVGNTGAVFDSISKNQIENILIPTPPIPEQQRIVAILDQAFEGIAKARTNAEQNLQNARALFEIHLQSLFTQHGEGWAATKLGAEIDLFVGFAFKSAHYTTSPDDVRLLRGDNIIQGRLRWDDVKMWPSHDSAIYSQYSLREGDVVLAMDRPWVKAGLKHATISADDLPCLLVQRTACLRAGLNLHNRFLVCILGSVAFTNHILGVQTGSGVPHISGQQIKDFQFSRPPINEQKHISQSLDSLQSQIQRLEALYQRKIALLDELKKSLLQQAFAGEL